MSVKVLTVGSAVGSIRDLFAKIKAIDAKHGKFDLVLCTGDFFGPLDSASAEDETTQLLAGILEAPIECYIMQGDSPLSDAVIQKFAKTGGELCKNVFLMNKSGIITTANGLRIACLGGRYDPEIYTSAEAAPGFSSPFFSTHTMERLLSNTLTTSTAKQNYKSLADIQSTASSSQLIDVLITNVWPAAITNFSSAPLPAPELASIGVHPLDDTIRRTQPRYHFAAAGGQPPMFWEREPYLWDDTEGRVSRFVSLGAFGGEPTTGKKQRWFYAFTIAPNSPAAAPAPPPANATKNPFTESFARPTKRPFESTAEGENFIFGNVRQPQKRTRLVGGDPGKPPPGYKCHRCQSSEHLIDNCPERQKPPEGYVCKICDMPGHLVRDCPTRFALGDTGGRKPKPGYVCRACGSDAHLIDDCPASSQRPQRDEHRGRGPRRGPPKEIAPDECWFCLSNPNLAKHLIVAIGSECYVTLPKGQIIPTQSAAEHVVVPGGGHVLIVPITHYPTYSTIPGDLAAPIVEETEKHKAALRAMYAKYGAAIVVFEVGRLSAKGGHAHVQAVPVPAALKDKVEEAFRTEGRMSGIDFEEDPDAALEACAGGRGSYFRVDLPDGRKLVHLMKDHVPFGIQFGRQVLVSLLNIPERLDWKACTLPEDEDRADAQAFKAAFAPFDPTL
ncbi:CwfJ C-terminus 1-domain-containing protein-like protein [Mycena alexandri]|uniref:CwfJ C-terminus 1-domain-containing protein-like protein n=1 Tax=Mycena alexandri TaxID=1745969 RepID=A0AAD6TLT5_9AGAR|nr:CwfJ C-terminus 1-domain-containing protein-like protein [Mycena alexandri]